MEVALWTPKWPNDDSNYTQTIYKPFYLLSPQSFSFQIVSEFIDIFVKLSNFIPYVPVKVKTHPSDCYYCYFIHFTGFLLVKITISEGDCLFKLSDVACWTKSAPSFVNGARLSHLSAA